MWHLFDDLVEGEADCKWKLRSRIFVYLLNEFESMIVIDNKSEYEKPLKRGTQQKAKILNKFLDYNISFDQQCLNSSESVSIKDG